MAKENGLYLYAWRKRRHQVLILTKADPAVVGYPAVAKLSTGMSPAGRYSSRRRQRSCLPGLKIQRAEKEIAKQTIFQVSALDAD